MKLRATTRAQIRATIEQLDAARAVALSWRGDTACVAHMDRARKSLISALIQLEAIPDDPRKNRSDLCCRPKPRSGTGPAVHLKRRNGN